MNTVVKFPLYHVTRFLLEEFKKSHPNAILRQLVEGNLKKKKKQSSKESK